MPMVGGVVTSTIMELLVYPAIFYLWRRRGLAAPPSAPLAPAPLPSPSMPAA